MRVWIEDEPMAVKSGKKTPALKGWSEKVVQVLSQRPSLGSGNYRVRIDFLIPLNRYQLENKQNPQAKDLDNLVVPVFDALSKTVLKDAAGDGAIIELFAKKRPAAPSERPGIRVTITPRDKPTG